MGQRQDTPNVGPRNVAPGLVTWREMPDDCEALGVGTASSCNTKRKPMRGISRGEMREPRAKHGPNTQPPAVACAQRGQYCGGGGGGL